MIWSVAAQGTVMNVRTLAERKHDALQRLTADVDIGVATADGAAPYLVPLSFLWDGETLLLSTAQTP
jgi:nitroimidazol reductase NimA-like FMN-containing flavoprotein (pyridoxamine 5'-phosphate oxidase superfamily)